MSNGPDFIDNIDGNTMAAALKYLLSEEGGNSSEALNNSNSISSARIATAYFSPEGFSRIATPLGKVNSVKLLLGSDPIGDTSRWQKKLDESEQKFVARKLREKLKSQEDSLRAERDHIPFSKAAGSAVKQLVESLKAGNMEVRRYEEAFLHAKAYIFSSDHDRAEAVFAGSSNLTSSGLSTNLELNLGRFDSTTVNKASQWFDRLWDEAIPFDLARYYESIFEPKAPFEIFLRVLWELYASEIDLDSAEDKGLPLTSFQKHGVVRALRLIRESGGVIVADEVGLGKTFVAGEILAHYQERRQRALLVCPAALRDTSWANFVNEFELYLEVVSFEQLARDKQLWDEKRRPQSQGSHLARNIDEYQLIIVDEAHNYRNPDSPTRADALRALLYGKRKDVLMLTATPVNNSLWDLYHLIRFFVKQDSFLASIGIRSIKERFDHAMRTNPSSLSPDVLYPVVDATTVKRTRQFIRKHYPNDQVKINGVLQTIVFPEPVALSVRYDLEDLMPGLFNLIETYFDPENSDCITFARYRTDEYLIKSGFESETAAHTVMGLLLSGLLKRFESSTGAFRVSIKRLIDQHESFLKALSEGYVVSTEFFKESSGTDDQDFDELLTESDDAVDSQQYDHERLKDDVEQDAIKLRHIYSQLKNITPDQDPKLLALTIQLEKILEEAELQSTSRQDGINKRKVLIFSFFADTVHWINEYLKIELTRNTKLSAYIGRLDIVVGSGQGEEGSKARAAAKFAPATAGVPGDPDETDILVSTDVLAEGVNLQQARHIINYDLPWNPMRLVQRHGRIDRIGSQHDRVFMRTIFPSDRLDALLGLEEKISRKLAMAAASVGIVSPIEGTLSANRNFTENKDEIQKLLDENASLYERGGTVSGTQSGEEYRQTLRKEMEAKGDAIKHIPWKSGSGIKRGSDQGIFFCAKVGERTYLRFVHANEDWTVKLYQAEEHEDDQNLQGPIIEQEIGRCLRLIECTEDEDLVMTDYIQDAAYDLWAAARENIYQHWTFETDPVNLQPQVRPLNRAVADFIRANVPSELDRDQIETALDTVETPWSRRDESRLRTWFQRDLRGAQKSRYLIQQILDSGLEPSIPPEPLPPINIEDIELLVWMGISSN